MFPRLGDAVNEDAKAFILKMVLIAVLMCVNKFAMIISGFTMFEPAYVSNVKPILLRVD